MIYDPAHGTLAVAASGWFEIEGKLVRRIQFTSSDDRGAHFRAPQFLDAHAPAVSSQYQVALASSARGEVGLLWLDTRMTSLAESGYDAFFALSRDGGASFSTAVRLSAGSSSPREVATQDPGATWLQGWDDTRWLTGGDYLGLGATAEGEFHAAWPDARTGAGHDGIQQPYSARIRVK